tara:strand:- start:1025 stop:1579 length:555 start_codon:yes stop_codon:yes gene_type:complete
LFSCSPSQREVELEKPEKRLDKVEDKVENTEEKSEPSGVINLDDPLTLKKILSGAAVFEEMEKRSLTGEQLHYLPNTSAPYTGWVKIMYSTGKPFSLFQMREGISNGLQVGWFLNGQKRHETNFKNGKKDGLSKVWVEKGYKYKETNWKAGRKNGEEIWLNEDGKKIREAIYHDDEKLSEKKFE